MAVGISGKEFITINVKVDPALTNIAARVRKGIIKGLERAAEVAKDKARDSELPGTFETQGGDLRNKKIQRDAKANPNKLSIAIGINETTSFTDKGNPPYGFYQNDGTKFIKAKRFIEKGIAATDIEGIVMEEIEVQLNK